MICLPRPSAAPQKLFRTRLRASISSSVYPFFFRAETRNRSTSAAAVIAFAVNRRRRVRTPFGTESGVQALVDHVEFALHRRDDVAVLAKGLGAGALVAERTGFRPIRSYWSETAMIERRGFLPGTWHGPPKTELLNLEAELFQAAQPHLGMADLVPGVPGGVVVEIEREAAARVIDVGDQFAAMISVELMNIICRTLFATGEFFSSR